MTLKPLYILLLAAVPAAFAAAAPAPAAAARAAADPAPLGCLIDASAVVEIGAPVIGLLESVAVERGDLVRRGQELARMESRVERAALTVAQTRVRHQADIQSARAQQDYAAKKAERTAELTQLKFVSHQALEQADTEASMAENKLAQALEQRALAEQELMLARAQLEQRTISSPISGVVVERYSSPGERIENRPILKIAQIDPLRVEVVMPSALFGRIKVGQRANVRPDVADPAPRTATVTVVDRVIDAASSTFRVRLALPNGNLGLPSGVRCKIDFAL